jgi:hypothetical protein
MTTTAIWGRLGYGVVLRRPQMATNTEDYACV